MNWTDALDPKKYTGYLDKQTLAGRAPSILTKETVDPSKQAVATPMSKYLASQVGVGLPKYEGELSADLGEEGERAYSDFLKMDAGDWYDKAVADPTMKQFKEDLLPEIREGYAGSLRGSGRFKAEEAGISELTESLAQGRYVAERDIPMQQFQMATQFKAMKDADFEREYKGWMASLPQTNPVLGQALQYLQESTSSGMTLLAALDPGQTGGWIDLLKAGALLESAQLASRTQPTSFIESFYMKNYEDVI